MHQRSLQKLNVHAWTMYQHAWQAGHSRQPLHSEREHASSCCKQYSSHRGAKQCGCWACWHIGCGRAPWQIVASQPPQKLTFEHVHRLHLWTVSGREGGRKLLAMRGGAADGAGRPSKGWVGSGERTAIGGGLRTTKRSQGAHFLPQGLGPRKPAKRQRWPKPARCLASL